MRTTTFRLLLVTVLVTALAMMPVAPHATRPDQDRLHD